MRLGILLLLVGCLVAPGLSGAQEDDDAPAPKARHARPVAAKPVPAPSLSGDDRALLRQLADAQRGLGNNVQQLTEHVQALQGDLAAGKDDDTATQAEVKALREEVKGLYVEISGVKQQIEDVRTDVGGVNSNVSAFRTFSGFFIAAMILLLAVIFAMTVRR
jgi:hypothetical protein